MKRAEWRRMMRARRKPLMSGEMWGVVIGHAKDPDHPFSAIRDALLAEFPPEVRMAYDTMTDPVIEVDEDGHIRLYEFGEEVDDVEA